MKSKWIAVFAFLLTGLTLQGWAQTNTFPSNGNVGIGTLNPNAELEIIGSSGSRIELRDNDEQSNWGFVIKQNSDLKGYIGIAGRDLKITTGWDKHLILGNQNYDSYGGGVVIPWGKVGIGTSNPTEKLTINGTAKAAEIIVEENTGADFVFEEGYNLPTLADIEKYIGAHKHLPEIPSAEEMKRDGVKVGALQMKLLQKIEELTLYTIKQKKLIKKQKKENQALRERISDIEEKLNLPYNQEEAQK